MVEPVLAMKTWITNGHLIADVARLGYLKDTDRILDVTWGDGNFWSQWHPEAACIFGSDIDPTKSPSSPADFRHLDTWENGELDVVVLDPPYKLEGRPNAKTGDRYGLTLYMGATERHQMICDGITECTRVLKVDGIFLLKCQDQVCSGRIWWQTDIFTRCGESVGLIKIDRFDMLGTGRPQPPRTRADGKPSVQQHAYGRSSSLLVFRKKGK